jgi:glucokinase
MCTCGSKGCLQSVASGPSILRRYLQLQGRSSNRNCDINKELDLDLKQVACMANNGHELARQVFIEAGVYIGKAIANLVMLFDVSLIVLGGGVMESGALIYDTIVHAAKESLENKRKIKIVKSSLQGKNGVLGALSLVMDFI